MQAIGQDERHISISSSDKTGQGLHLIESAEAAVFRKVYFSNLRNLQRPYWHLTGAVTCYESAVVFEACVFRDNQSEDALNLIRCEAKLNRVKVKNTSADGIDMDFCEADIKALFVDETANDGLDVSGSIINIENSILQNCHDKGISVGEDSDLFVSETEIKGASMAIAAKDLSMVSARNVILQNCKQGFVAFQKKPEFGPASIIVEHYEATNVNKLYEIGPGSRLQLNNKVISDNF